MPAVPLQSLWSATAPAGPALTALSAARRAQVVIVGAGYTGLSAALHLAIAGRDVVVLEALEVGECASGLNGGQVIPGLKHDPDTLEELFGPELGARLVSTAATAADLVFELVARHGIECQSTRAGWIQPATSQQALTQLAARAQQWQRRGAAVEMLSREAVAALTGSPRYCGGLLDRRGGKVQPLALVRGLARAVLGAGGQVFTRSPAIRLVRVGSDWRIDTPQGSVTSQTVILATNAYTDGLAGALRRTLIRVPSFQVATQPLSAANAQGNPAAGAGGVRYLAAVALFSHRCQRAPGARFARHVRRRTGPAGRAPPLSRRARDLSAARRRPLRVPLGRLGGDHAAITCRTCTSSPPGCWRVSATMAAALPWRR